MQRSCICDSIGYVGIDVDVVSEDHRPVVQFWNFLFPSCFLRKAADVASLMQTQGNVLKWKKNEGDKVWHFYPQFIR